MPTYNLTELINALNKEEIRNFKLYSSRINNTGDGESKTILLFDLIKTQQLDEFSDEVVGKVYPGGNKNAFYRLKNRLISDIEQSLLLLNRNKDNRFKVYNTIQLAQIFRYKSEYDQAFNYLKKAEKHAIKYNFTDVLDSIYTEILNLASDYYLIDPELYIEKKNANFENLGKQQGVENLLSTVNYKLRNSNYSDKETDIHKVVEDLIDQIKIGKETADDVNVQFRIFNLFATNLVQKRSFEQLQSYLIDSYEQFKDKQFFEANPEEIFWVLHWISNCLFANNADAELINTYIDLYEEALEKNNGKFKKKYIWRYHEIKTHYFNRMDDIESCLNLLNEIKDNPEYEGTNFYDIFVYYNLAIFYYRNGNLSKAMSNIAPLVVSGSTKKLHFSYQLSIAIVDVILHYDNRDYNYVLYKISEIKRIFRKHLKEEQFVRERDFLNIVRLLVNKGNDFSDTKLASKVDAYIEKHKPMLPRGDREGIFLPIWLESKKMKIKYSELTIARKNRSQATQTK